MTAEASARVWPGDFLVRCAACRWQLLAPAPVVAALSQGHRRPELLGMELRTRDGRVVGRYVFDRPRRP